MVVCLVLLSEKLLILLYNIKNDYFFKLRCYDSSKDD